MPVRLGIKAKILTATGLVVAVSLLASGTFAYVYFQKIFKEKAIQDDRVKLDQIAQHLEYQIKDIQKLATSIIIDPEMQDFIQRTRYASVYEQIARARREMEFINNQVFLREDIHSAAVVCGDGLVWMTQGHFAPVRIADLAQAGDLKGEAADRPFYFSGPYRIPNVNHGTPTAEVVSCVGQFRNMDRPDRVTGHLILNIYLNHFIAYLKLNIEEYDAFYWLSPGNGLLFRKPAPGGDRQGLGGVRWDPARSYQVIERPSGYWIVNQSLSNGWRLVSFTSGQKLFHRIGFLVYFFLIFTLVSLVLIIMVVLPLILRITRPITQLTAAMNRVAGGNLDIALEIASHDELQTMAGGFNQMVRDLRNLMAKSVEDEKAKRRLEFDILLSQINPHFIYNVLNSVVYLARKEKNRDIADLVNSFIRVLQDGVQVGSEGLLVPVRQEMEIVNHYVTIQQYRYRDRFELTWRVADDLLDHPIPKTIIQPLVENALLHGVYPLEGKGIIGVTVARRGEELEITVSDNGVGMEPDLIARLLSGETILEQGSRLRSIGIANIRDRLRYLYGAGSDLQITSAAGRGTRVVVTIPFHAAAS
ncbi:two-component system sensor histidine kinase YesM [Hydrogenispora ethanolica]|uniref:histidine kinase n=1 Tax=Hydrogenispora ethanolica TaxID=1082276 RepID=A0A4R1SAL9_HYDET|nr:histidine kinase [Hydrogenispora ethanolica]TCL76264.1 two-component system sensor histidine kinase YesM [Hydrogenispora ethanolica]